MSMVIFTIYSQHISTYMIHPDPSWSIYSIDWFKAKNTGNSNFSWENPWFPVDFPLVVNPLIYIHLAFHDLIQPLVGLAWHTASVAQLAREEPPPRSGTFHGCQSGKKWADPWNLLNFWEYEQNISKNTGMYLYLRIHIIYLYIYIVKFIWSLKW